MDSLDRYALDKLAELERDDLRRGLTETTRLDGLWVERDGRRVLSFSCNDYLNLSHHPAVKQAAIDAIARYGAGAGAARLVTGNNPVLTALEQRLARFKGTAAACVFGSGYLANAGIIPALAGPQDLVLVDDLAHACIHTGARLTRGPVLRFRHNDLDDLRRLLDEHRARSRHVLIATDGVFSMDGDLAPVPALAALAVEYDAWLITDDAHGLGTIAGGRGSSVQDGRRAAVPLQMGTLSKAVGGYGGYLCASAPVIELVRNRARTFVYSTGLPPAAAAAAIAALDIIAQDPALCARPLAKARAFTRAAGLPEATSPIVPVVVGAAPDAVAAAQMLLAEGFLVVPIRPPTVPDGTARLRIAFTAAHPDEAVQRLATLVRERILVEVLA